MPWKAATPIGEVGHGLAQLVFFVNVLNPISLVDNVDKMTAFRLAPEHFFNTKAE